MLFISTSGLGEIAEPALPRPRSFQPDEVLIVSGPIGCLGAAILCAREKFDFAPVVVIVIRSASLLLNYQARLTPRSARDATRGVATAVLHQWADASELTCIINEFAVPIADGVRMVSEIPGLDPLNFANKGTFVLITPPQSVESTLDFSRQH